MKTSPTQAKRKPSAVSLPQKTGATKISLNQKLVMAALIIALPCAGAWAMWKDIRPETPAPSAPAANVQQTSNTMPTTLPNAPAAKDPQSAAQAFAEARQQEKYIIGPWIPTYKMLAFSEKAVALDSTKPAYLVYLMQVYVSLRRSKEAIATGQKLLVLNPNHPWGNVMLANQMLDNGAKPDDYSHIESMLKFAENDPNLAPALHYGRGLLALRYSQASHDANERRRHAVTAVAELKQACALAPDSSTGFYDLSLAERLAGNASAAARAMAQHRPLREAQHDALKEHDLLNRHPETLQDYVRLVRIFESKGLKEPANAFRTEGHKKYGAALDAALNKKSATSKKP